MNTLKNDVLNIIDEAQKANSNLNLKSIKKDVESITLDGDVNRFVEACLIKTKVAIQRNKLIKKAIHKDFNSLNRTVEHYSNLERVTTFDNLVLNQEYSTKEICSLIGKFSAMKGMYVVQNGYQKEVLIKATIDDDSNIYHNTWISYKEVLSYIPEAQKQDYSLANILKCKPNFLIYDGIMNHHKVNVHVFARDSRKKDYEYCGIFHAIQYIEGDIPYFVLNFDHVATPDVEFYHEMDDEEYNNNASKINADDVEVTADKPSKKKAPQFNSKQRRIYHRNPEIAVQAKKISDYMCEFNEKHITFVNEKDQNNYVEAHHLIPASKEDEFEYDIDVSANVVSLCPICHRCLHHGNAEDKKKLLAKLYQERSKRLETCKIAVDITKLLKYYKVK